MSEVSHPIHVVGGGLAGTEAAWQIARSGVPVVLHEMRPHQSTPAHETDSLAELVCSTSFRSDDADFNAVGLLHQEMRLLDSLILRCADHHKVPAGAALTVDRTGFANAVQLAIESEALISIERNEVKELPPDTWGQQQHHHRHRPPHLSGSEQSHPRFHRRGRPGFL